MKKLLKVFIYSLCVSTIIVPLAKANVIPVTVYGNKFVYNDGSHKRINIKAICFQPVDNPVGAQDAISDANLENIENLYENYWKKANINTIRVYQVDPTQDHSQVMNYLNSKGIYVMIGMVTGGPAATCIYARNANANYNLAAVCSRVIAVAKKFNIYSNVLCYSVSNELLAQPISNGTFGAGSDPMAASYVKGVIKYLKAYQKQYAPRNIPIGVVLRDDPSFTLDAMSYYISGSKDECADFIGYNTYRWNGGDDTGRMNAYLNLYNLLAPIARYAPIILTEYGGKDCVDMNNARSWTQIPYVFGNKTVFGKNMADVICGGCVFRFYNRSENFGLIDSNNMLLTPFGGWNNLVNQYSSIDNNGPIADNTHTPVTIPINNPGNQFNKPLPILPPPAYF
ncbi:MAG TPA: hypothetical protein QF753_12690 [Victivallales bacterium]|nr:hypothetical protein [Victivallales bacterium]